MVLALGEAGALPLLIHHRLTRNFSHVASSKLSGSFGCTLNGLITIFFLPPAAATAAAPAAAPRWAPPFTRAGRPPPASGLSPPTVDDDDADAAAAAAAAGAACAAPAFGCMALPATPAAAAAAPLASFCGLCMCIVHCEGIDLSIRGRPSQSIRPRMHPIISLKAATQSINPSRMHAIDRPPLRSRSRRRSGGEASGARAAAANAGLCVEWAPQTDSSRKRSERPNGCQWLSFLPLASPRQPRQASMSTALRCPAVDSSSFPRMAWRRWSLGLAGSG